ncbi:hypothetical protein DFJ77DRAFT_468081 [Powellomyces hirtus]|nr:hypothetical protein DFJ77DRAFT_468081 [Powellomyces hirtus]
MAESSISISPRAESLLPTHAGDKTNTITGTVPTEATQDASDRTYTITDSVPAEAAQDARLVQNSQNGAGSYTKRVRGAASRTWKGLTVSEISGSLGDLGTLLPIIVALSKTGQISLSASLIFGGLYNIITGLTFGIPMCVQPMKAIAAVALASNMPMEQIVTAGFSVSAIILVLGVTRTISVLNVLIPLPVVRGIQFGTGLTLVSKGVATIKQSDRWEFGNYSWLDNYLIATLSLIVVLSFYNNKRNPSALIIFIFGLSVAAAKIWGGFRLTGGVTTVPTPGFSFPSAIHPSGSDFKNGFLKAGLGQLPLTTLNSVIAVCKLADDLFPRLRKPVASVTHVAVCVGLMNIVGMWFGAMPFCHGSGGLAAQYRFGARTGTSMYFLGVIKLLLGLIFGSSLLALFTYIPFSILGVMLIAAGIEIISITKDLGGLPALTDRKRGDAFAIMLFTGCSTSFFANDGVGFLVGLVASTVFWISRCRHDGMDPYVDVRAKVKEVRGAWGKHVDRDD